MAVGIGTDIVSVPRIARLIDGREDAFLQRWFTPDEIVYCRGQAHPERHFAARFAAKESVFKALRCDWHGPPPWRFAEVVPDASGAPTLTVAGPLLAAAQSARVGRFLLSLSHCAEYATATVLADEAAGEPTPT